MTVATAALIGSAGLVSAQAPGNAPNAPAASQTAPSAGAPADKAAPSGEMKGGQAQKPVAPVKHPTSEVVKAWPPWVILTGFVFGRLHCGRSLAVQTVNTKSSRRTRYAFFAAGLRM